MQETMVYAGQLDSYGQGNEMIEKMTGVSVSNTQQYRVTDSYGKQSETVVNESRTLSPLQPDDVLYMLGDGSFVLTKDGWKEVKLGRMFKASDCMDMSSNRGWVKHSQYVAHLGESGSFTQTMDELIDSFGPLGERLVFISDGAPWLKNWVADSFPGAVQILDLYHALEYLHEFKSACFTNAQKAEAWVERQKELLLKSEVKKVIQNIKRLKTAPKQAAQKIIQYYESNIDRMDYARYVNIGCGIIGSGAIESAHKTVIQQRMKQSGQRWTMQGAQNMLNLRVLNENRQWNKVIDMARYGFKQAA